MLYFVVKYLIVARLVGGNSRRGRVEILRNNVWGTICDDGFTNASAWVICNMLSFGYDSVVTINFFS